ncbi:MAG TPA: hypothetical protein IAA57_04165 [Candidatus Pullilachnospira intestinigallinarum]|nr:hypothetical protein [Candidatus Pullilachnospira intestinigallinarum]
MEDRLVLLALEQIAEALGHSNNNPLSTSLLCLEHGISFDEMGKIMVAFNQILRRKEFDDLEVSDFREALEEITPVAREFSDSVVVAFIKAYARNHIAELVPFARTLD